MKYVAYFCFFLFLSQIVNAQEKEIEIKRTNGNIKIDGDLHDEAWQESNTANQFVQMTPNFGKPASQNTTVKILYDDYSIFIAFMCYDKPENIVKNYSMRDADSNSDYIGIYFDTYNDDINSFYISVGVAGNQYDARDYNGNFDSGWNAVWQSATQVTGEGWTAEFRIPFSALRFPKKNIQDWGINFTRYLQKNREESYWSPVDPNKNITQQCGKLKGLQHIESPLRLSLTPYATMYAESESGFNDIKYRAIGGLDVKYGINESFTLDMMLVPDFGQVRNDQLRYTLEPYEIRYDDNRQFFKEGIELFNKNDMFYTRRIGEEPSEISLSDPNDSITKYPGRIQLLNATKISGRNKHKVGIGFFNAITQNTYATVYNKAEGTTRKVLTDPLTNYNVLSIDKMLPYNSSIGFMNTNVYRSQNGRLANVSLLNTALRTKSRTYGFNHRFAYSYIQDNFSNAKKSDKTGFESVFSIGKQQGKFIWEVVQQTISSNFDKRDLGYMEKNNFIANAFNVVYNENKESEHLRSWGLFANVWQAGRVQPYLNSGYGFNFNSWITNLQNHSFGFSLNGNLTDFKDHIEARLAPYYFRNPAGMNQSFWLSTNYAKKLAFDINLGNYFKYNAPNIIHSYSMSVRWRPHSKILCITSHDNEANRFQQGFSSIQSEQVIFGLRNINTISNGINIIYLFNTRMSIQLITRHYNFKVKYLRYYNLKENGDLQPLDNYNNDNSFSFNAFSNDFLFNYEFRPASWVSIVWKNAYNNVGNYIENYKESLRQVSQNPHPNSISVRLLWFIDYQDVRKIWQKKMISEKKIG